MELISNIVLNMQAPAYATVYSPQGQTLARSVRAALMDGQTPWEIPEEALMVICYAKPDGTIGFYDTMEDDSSAYSYDDNYVTFGIAAQALTVPGTVLMQLDFYSSDDEKLSTFSFRLEVQAGVFPDEEIISSDYINVLTSKIAEAAEIFEQIKGAYGAPRAAATVAGMTDHSLIYVYTGSETGYVAGNWYYWNGTAWTSGGVYNSNTTVDQTLTIQGDAADAKATGDAVNDLKSALDENVVELIRNTGYTASNVVAPYDDLNSFPENEIAYYTSGNVATNSPTTEAFQIICYRSYKHTTRQNTGKQQIVITVSNKIYVRTCTGVTETWSDWDSVLTSDNFDSLISILRNTGFNSSNVVAPFDDLNTFPENQSAYYINGSAALNSPTADGCIVLSLRPYNQSSRPAQNTIQMVITLTNDIFIRSNTTIDQVWSDWGKIKTDRLDAITSCYTDYLPSKYNIDSNSKLLFSGDSITYGVTSDTPYDHSHGYVNLILDKFGCSGYNMGVSGASYADIGYSTILQQLQTAVSQSKLTGDYLFVFAGTNDYGGGASLSDLRDALDDTYDYIDQNYTGIVTIILPIGRPSIPPNSIKPLDDYVQTIFEKAIERGYNILNGMSFGFPEDGTTPSYTTAVMSDGTHPTILGHQILANKILQYIDTNSTIPNASGVSF